MLYNSCHVLALHTNSKFKLKIVVESNDRHRGNPGWIYFCYIACSHPTLDYVILPGLTRVIKGLQWGTCRRWHNVRCTSVAFSVAWSFWNSEIEVIPSVKVFQNAYSELMKRRSFFEQKPKRGTFVTCLNARFNRGCVRFGKFCYPDGHEFKITKGFFHFCLR